ncbi:MAG: hypothetical protein HY885_05325 [Deltaproteobacteria bacterium]|nr:hypothetical protein [Deltaproteobacteria bacterium]
MKTIPNNIQIKIQSKSAAQNDHTAEIEQEVSGNIIVLAAFAPLLVGVWVAACFVGAVMMSDGSVNLFQSWLSAITPMF